MSRRVRAHVRSNVIGYLALFVALSGSAYAVKVAPHNSVVSQTIKNGQVKGVDISRNAVNGAKVADGSLTGADIDPTTLSVPPSGTAGGDLTGNFPDPTIDLGVVNGSKIANGGVQTRNLADGAVTSAKLAEGAVSSSSIQNRSLSDSSFGTPIQIASGLVDLPTVGAGLCNKLDLPGITPWDQVGEVVIITASDGVLGDVTSGHAGLFFTPFVVTSPGTATGAYCNVTNASIDPASEALTAVSIRH